MTNWEQQKPEEILSDLNDVIDTVRKQAFLPYKLPVKVVGPNEYETIKKAVEKYESK